MLVAITQASRAILLYYPQLITPQRLESHRGPKYPRSGGFRAAGNVANVATFRVRIFRQSDSINNLPRVVAGKSGVEKLDERVMMAERVGFEPTMRFLPYTRSRRAP